MPAIAAQPRPVFRASRRCVPFSHLDPHVVHGIELGGIHWCIIVPSSVGSHLREGAAPPLPPGVIQPLNLGAPIDLLMMCCGFSWTPMWPGYHLVKGRSVRTNRPASPNSDGSLGMMSIVWPLSHSAVSTLRCRRPRSKIPRCSCVSGRTAGLFSIHVVDARLQFEVGQRTVDVRCLPANSVDDLHKALEIHADIVVDWNAEVVYGWSV